LDEESSKPPSTIVIVHTRQNAQLAMGCSPRFEFGSRLRTLKKVI
ncbi:hypothetical protein A2U01_0075609, partial [Trifolium medium]|nr:hypothetical protein [Trifolium medium]